MNERSSCCAVCGSGETTGSRMSRVVIEGRSLELCRSHTATVVAAMPETFEDLKTPLKVTATDFYGHRLHVIDSGELRSALAASAALPAIFEPVRRDGRLLIDGGFYNPVPWDLIQDAADIVLAIDVVGAPEPTRTRGPSAVDLLYGASQLMMQSVIAAKLHQSAPDILLRPPVSRFRVLDFLKIDSVLAETAVLKDEVKRSVDAALEKRANDYCAIARSRLCRWKKATGPTAAEQAALPFPVRPARGRRLR